MKYQDVLDEINSLISRSCGANVSLPSGEEYEFEVIKRYSMPEVYAFESKFNVKLPEEYKVFLMIVGASKLYFDEYGLGIEFLGLESLESFSGEVFKNMKNPFPRLLIIASNNGRGDFISYGMIDELQSYRLATFSHEEDPESWLLQEGTKWSNLKRWLKTLVDSEGEEDTI